MTRESNPHVVAVMDSLINVRDLDDANMREMLLSAATGDAEAVEWAMARLGDLMAARDALEVLIVSGIAAGGMLPINDLADAEGKDRAGFRRRLRARGVRTVMALNVREGPRVVAYVTREGAARLGIAHMPAPRARLP